MLGNIFFLFCGKYTDLRIILFNKLHLKIPVLQLNINECFKLFYDLMSHSQKANIRNKRQKGFSMFTDVFLLIFFFVASGIRNCNSENPVSLFIADIRKMIPDIFFRRVSFFVISNLFAVRR